MKWLLRFFFFTLFAVVLVWAWMNPVNLWFSKPSFDNYVLKVSYDSLLGISDSLQAEIKDLKEIKEKQANNIIRQERKINKKIIEYRQETRLIDKVQDCNEIIKEYEKIEAKHKDYQIITDSIINLQVNVIDQKNKLIQFKDKQIGLLYTQMEYKDQQLKTAQINLEFTDKKLKRQKKIGLIIIGIITFIAIK